MTDNNRNNNIENYEEFIEDFIEDEQLQQIIMRSIEEEKNDQEKNKIKLIQDRELREQQDKEYLESLEKDKIKNNNESSSKLEIKNKDDDKVLSQQELREARIKYFCK